MTKDWRKENQLTLVLVTRKNRWAFHCTNGMCWPWQITLKLKIYVLREARGLNVMMTRIKDESNNCSYISRVVLVFRQIILCGKWRSGFPFMTFESFRLGITIWVYDIGQLWLNWFINQSACGTLSVYPCGTSLTEGHEWKPREVILWQKLFYGSITFEPSAYLNGMPPVIQLWIDNYLANPSVLSTSLSSLHISISIKKSIWYFELITSIITK